MDNESWCKREVCYACGSTDCELARERDALKAAHDREVNMLRAKIQNLCNDCIDCPHTIAVESREGGAWEWTPNAEQLTEIARTAAERDALKARVERYKAALERIFLQTEAYSAREVYDVIGNCRMIARDALSGEEVAK